MQIPRRFRLSGRALHRGGKTEGGAIFRFVLAAGEQALFTADNILDEVAKHLRSTFCGSFFGDVRVTEKEREALEEEVIEEADAPKYVFFRSKITKNSTARNRSRNTPRILWIAMRKARAWQSAGNSFPFVRENRKKGGRFILWKSPILRGGSAARISRKSNGGKDRGVTARYEYRLRGRFRGV